MAVRGATGRGKGGKGSSGRTTTTQSKWWGDPGVSIGKWGTVQKKRPATKKTTPKKKMRTIHKEKWKR